MSNQVTIMLAFQAVFLIAGFIFVSRVFKKQAEFFGEQAKKRNGSVKSELFGIVQGFSFPVEGLEATVFSRQGNRNSPPKSNFKCPITSSIELIICRESGLSKVGKMFGAQEVQLGVTSFDDLFLLKSSDGNFVRNLLTSMIQAKLLKCKDVYPTLKVNKTSLEFSVATYFNRHPELDDFIDTGILILKRLRELQ